MRVPELNDIITQLNLLDKSGKLCAIRVMNNIFLINNIFFTREVT